MLLQAVDYSNYTCVISAFYLKTMGPAACVLVIVHTMAVWVVEWLWFRAFINNIFKKIHEWYCVGINVQYYNNLK